MTIICSKQLTSEQKEIFISAFYENYAGPDDSQHPSPWGAPWLWRSEVLVDSSDIKSSALKHLEAHEEEMKDFYLYNYEIEI